MDIFGSALKAKMKKPSMPTKSDGTKPDTDEAPVVQDKGTPQAPDDGDAELSNLKSMGAGTPVSGPTNTLGARAKGKMNERMASIMKNKAKKA